MKTLVLNGAALAASLSLIGTAAAQQPAGAPSSPSAAAVEKRPVTLRGCLQSWDGTPTGVGVETPTGMTPLTYVLTDVEASAKERPPMPVGTSGAGGAVTGARSDAPKTGSEVAHGTYVVQAASGSVALADHLNREVEVTGVLEITRPHDANAAPGQSKPQGNAAPAGSPSTGAPAAAGTTAPQPVKVQKVTVEAVKVTAQSCAKR